MVAEDLSVAGKQESGLTSPSIVLVEDDEGDALLVRELLSEAAARVTIQHAGSLAQAKPLLAQADCVLLDLGLPDSQGLDGLRWLNEHVPGVAVVVLTGLADEHLGEEAVRAGAQDYLVKGQVSGLLLYRVIRYAVERRRSEETQRLLHEARISAQENSRLERGLLPVPLLSDPRLTVTTRYRPGGSRMLLGGDFYDVVQTADGWVHTMVGDVCGRGPDEAALGVCLRVAWRTMVLAARPTAEILATLAQLLEHERHHEKIFATLCMVSVAPERTHARLYLAGHPQPLLITEDGLAELRAPTCPPLGILPVLDWTGGEVQLGPDWTLLLYTDGLVEGRIGEGADRLNSEGLIDLIETFRHGEEGVRGRRGEHPMAADEAAGAWSPDQLLDWLIDEVHTRNGGPVDDDLAVLAMRCASQAGGPE